MIDENLRQRARNFSARKRLGQNFLISSEALLAIANQLHLTRKDQVLEIGPGLGFLSEILVSQAGDVRAVEIDPLCTQALNELALPRMKIIEEDFLKVDLNSIIDQPVKVVGNIPYNITTPIISKLLGEIGQPTPWLNKIRAIVLTVQRELADRLVADPGKKDYSQISLLMKYFGVTEMVLTLSPENFFPSPDVNSAVISFVPHSKAKLACQDHLLLRQVIQAGFARRRKMLKNNLRSLYLSDTSLGEIFTELNFDPHVRAENLSLEQYARLTDAIVKVRQSVPT